MAVMIDLRKWYQTRGSNFIWQRGQHLWARYGFSSKRAEARIEDCLACLVRLNCLPTFPVPAMVVQKHPKFITHLASLGAEIAVHGYNHIDLKSCSSHQASQELLRAVEVFNQFGLEAHGFRCPYLSCTDELIRTIPRGVFEYSSNRAIRWNVNRKPATVNDMVETLDRFYIPLNSENSICLPWFQDDLIEIPVCIPDDLQLFDGYQLTPTQVSQEWTRVIDKIHRRGELFTPMFHPELFTLCIEPLVDVLHAAARYEPKVWITRLDEIANWWREKDGFLADIDSSTAGLAIKLTCTPRATILLRDMLADEISEGESAQPWDGRYRRIKSNHFTVPLLPRPFIGITRDVPEAEKVFLREQGYILDSSELAGQCTIFLEKSRLAHFITRPIRQAACSPVDSNWAIPINRRSLLDWIEDSPGPLVRFWPWPDGYKCALSLSGDLDALSLLDYSNRLFPG
jgi:hypothetical protein